jgi:SAM-dependent methyltransferase
LKLNEKFDLIVSLYDVIGSFTEESENLKLIKTIQRHLKPGGFAVVSVMNLQCLYSKNVNTFSLKNNPEKILEIPVSSAMQSTGEVFDDVLLDSKTGIVYRREQFRFHGNKKRLPLELLVRDKRYLKEEIEKLFTGQGFDIIESKYVKLGHWDKSGAAEDCKEILLVLQEQM